MELKQQFLATYPNAFFLENKVAQVESYLRGQNWIQQDEVVQVLEKPGEGNMNFVLRVETNYRSFIIKQARPWVEKFPQIPAPVERGAVEAQFFQILSTEPNFASYNPICLGYDKNSFIIAVEDLGKGTDYSFLYQDNNQLTKEEIQSIAQYLSALHQINPPADFPKNKAMRLLNHEHIFNFPFAEENGFDLDEVQLGLQEMAMSYKKNTALKAIVEATGLLYLSSGKQLLHGDFYPGSWLKTTKGFKVIDPEFGFVGSAEFDAGVLIAHLLMAQQPKEMVQTFRSIYEKQINLNQSLLARYTGIEVLRRLIGIAQLPLPLSLKEKKELLDKAANWILSEQLDL